MKLQFQINWPKPVNSLVHLLRHYTKEIFIAFVLAIVAAIGIDRYQHKAKLQATLKNLKAVATLESLDNKDHAIGQGSGFFITHDGVLVTNYHVIKGAAKVIARLPSGAFYIMKGYRDIDEAADIAILQFDATETPAVSKLGDSDDLYVGEEIYAIGTPANLAATMSAGNVSNPLQKVGGRRFIQFTAPISPGSSGGGLFDEEGAVIGITAAFQNILSGPQAGTTQNLNLAVPINDVRDVLTGGVTALVRESPAFYYSLGNLADNKNEWDNAVKYYRRAISIDDNYTDAYMGLGGDYYEKGQFDLEADNYRKATLSDPHRSDAFYFLGTAYEDNDQYPEAAAAYEQALVIDPDYKDALHDLSILYLAQGRIAEAQKLLPRLHAVDKGWAKEAEMLLGRIRRVGTK
jgi:S1-C subfamily serine protease